MADALASGALVRILPDWRVAHTMGIYGVTPHRSYLPARVEVLLDALSQRLQQQQQLWQQWTESMA